PTSINHKNLSNRITNLKQVEIEKLCDGVTVANYELRAIIKEIKEDEQANWNAKRHGFTKDGIKLIRDTGECTLCDIEWPNGELKEYLQERLDGESARQAELSDNAKKLSEQANAIKIRIQQVNEIVRPVVGTKQAKASEIFL